VYILTGKWSNFKISIRACSSHPFFKDVVIASLIVPATIASKSASLEIWVQRVPKAQASSSPNEGLKILCIRWALPFLLIGFYAGWPHELWFYFEYLGSLLVMTYNVLIFVYWLVVGCTTICLFGSIRPI
jgi:hypothetical protein